MAEYKPRLKAPSTTDKNYLHTSHGGYNQCIHIGAGSCLPNCVGYAWGRWREILGKAPKLSRANAENWWSNTADGYKRGQTPKVGAVMCWRKGKAGVASDGAGHVAIVEQVHEDGSVTYSNSNYGGTRFYTKTLKPPYKLGSSYTFQGFIYLPIEFDETSFFPERGYFRQGDKHENIGKVAKFMRAMYPKYTPITALGNTYGTNIIKSITEFQSRTGLKADGLLGPKTLAMLVEKGFKY